ncbi:hypothetical protein GTZ99_04430 [Novosphingobium sp. FSY-8]|uniref:Uncharacterized protein n=2 Tax=Novosphingobium ovatum TaxID=1908523 RepID=A0ABW9XB82_9SPHN|nr:hypothetical protein [Novosphingobium ovatum]
MATAAFGASGWAPGAAIAQQGPESLLPPGYDRPARARPTASPAPVRAAPAAAPAVPRIEAAPVIAPMPLLPEGGAAVEHAAPVVSGPVSLPNGITSFDQLLALPAAQLDQLLGLTPKYDIPPAAQRSLRHVGIIAASEGGMGPYALVNQPGALVRAALAGNSGHLVSRWGHILLRRALASRMDAPQDMNPAEFVALRAALLVRMGEGDAARALVQDVDPGNYDATLTQAAMEAYVATADLTGFCPVMALQGYNRRDAQWMALQGICMAFTGQAAQGLAQLDGMTAKGAMTKIDMLLAQKYAGAAGMAGKGGRRAVKIEWEGISDMSPWRYALAIGVGLTPPASLMADTHGRYDAMTALAPMVGLGLRADASDRAGAWGILSAGAMVDLYSQIYLQDDITGGPADRALLLRDAYVGDSPEARADAMRKLWEGAGDANARYGRMVLTAYAAARLPASGNLASGAGDVLASMLAAGLDANAARWWTVVDKGSDGWAQLALAMPQAGAVDGGAIDSFRSADKSDKQHRTAMLVAGLAGLGRISDSTRRDYESKLEMRLDGNSRWIAAIDQAAAVNNAPLVAMLAGLGMQGDSWAKMTPRFLYHMVAALNRVGLNAEARMIAAEAVARG